MNPTDLIVDKNRLENAELVEPIAEDVPLAEGQVLLEVDMFGLTANNISYASAGDRMGYWAFFPGPDPAWGRVPAWGYAIVTRSEHPDIEIGEEIFGFVPMAKRFVVQPSEVTSLSFFDAAAHRVSSHPWYNRYYRTADDPVSKSGFRELQPVLWALFMTGWEIARDFVENDNHRASTVVVGSASSKTAVSFARTLATSGADVQLVGLTSTANADLVRGYGCYDAVMTYDALELGGLDGPVAFVDMSGNAALVAAVHAEFGDRLTKSYRVGGTHRTAGGSSGALEGPEREFFFIPDVAERHSADLGHAAYHDQFAQAWKSFVAWIAPSMSVRAEVGPAAIRRAYLDAFTSGSRPDEGVLLSFG